MLDCSGSLLLECFLACLVLIFSLIASSSDGLEIRIMRDKLTDWGSMFWVRPGLLGRFFFFPSFCSKSFSS